jgi:hypothetical protein
MKFDGGSSFSWSAPDWQSPGALAPAGARPIGGGGRTCVCDDAARKARMKPEEEGRRAALDDAT